MKFAVASEDFQSISGHAGHAARFLVYEAEAGEHPVEIARIDLNEEQTVHNFKGGAHPLDGVQVLIAGSAGGCFVEKMKERGITTVVAPNMAPATAVAAYMLGILAPLTEAGACSCSHEH
ncbi:putative Fe-Mo cluster-binding NifX family protein [Rhizomicrobium palustre]|uniref:Putative Fe-Mo cluster-binding NifX family protein n=1 Tax=Rhizomicrobium palustre TaxID=189966 RepID=A0A846N205_9PROT|nr:putative Fe-Mo cluster-binding NifX family protein [Rhizomicrobium palustre]